MRLLSISLLFSLVGIASIVKSEEHFGECSQDDSHGACRYEPDDGIELEEPCDPNSPCTVADAICYYDDGDPDNLAECS
ncbi:uncharacterized protein LTHEOB_3342 [Lasiodiplodia theobromae]|uniref:uncharacterized protein n=1 Tax=Lasiodiplodia theobromae TaxID=45133 RepID=UPI0015C2C3CE|nr:uncharacterized protein LTHEOB_3342 [Lasiodiplodia theobromae]KAF4534534.1 hypothetical protein LTHEOB_3342 [Lasiodiplodia theobromae]